MRGNIPEHHFEGGETDQNSVPHDLPVGEGVGFFGEVKGGHGHFWKELIDSATDPGSAGQETTVSEHDEKLVPDIGVADNKSNSLFGHVSGLNGSRKFANLAASLEEKGIGTTGNTSNDPPPVRH